MNDTDTIPVLSKQFEIHPFNVGEYVVVHKRLKYHVNINESTYNLLSLVDGKRDINDLAKVYRERHEFSLSSTDISFILYKNLAKYGIVEQDEFEVKKQKRADYLKLSFIFLPARLLDRITPFFLFLFNKRTFYWSLSLSILLVGSTISMNYIEIKAWAADEMSFKSYFPLYIVLLYVGALLHELGHATACKKFNAQHGGIGFGFYFFMPVLFADVTSAWKLSREERIIVNLGGIYFQLLLSSVSMSLYFVNYDIGYIILPSAFVLGTLPNLNPFFRMDGYWVLSDAIEVPNLRHKSIESLKTKWQELLKGSFVRFDSPKHVFLFIYGLVSTSFIFFFLGTTIFFNPSSIINFPIDLYHLATNWNEFELKNLNELLTPLIFWVVAIKFSIAKITSFIRT